MATHPDHCTTIEPLTLPRWRRSAIDWIAAPVYAAIALGFGFLTIVCIVSSFGYEGILNGTALGLLSIVGFGMAARWIGFTRLGGATEAMGLFGMLAVLAPLCAVVAASTALPLADDALVRADYLLFRFERQRLLDVVTDWPVFMEATRTVYHSLIGQPFLLIALLAATRQQRRIWAFLFAWAGTLAITIAVFPFLPAVGAPPYFFDFLGTFEGARDGSLRILGYEALTGIITFPSFHAAAAVLLGWGYTSVRWVGPWFVGLNALMFASALIAGHYLIDLVAGGLIAWLAILIANHVYRHDALTTD